jgi:hypothetical protein
LINRISSEHVTGILDIITGNHSNTWAYHIILVVTNVYHGCCFSQTL